MDVLCELGWNGRARVRVVRAVEDGARVGVLVRPESDVEEGLDLKSGRRKGGRRGGFSRAEAHTTMT